MKPVRKTASSHTKFILNIDFCYVTWPMSFATVWNGLSAQRSLRTDLIHCCFSYTRSNSQRQLNEWRGFDTRHEKQDRQCTYNVTLRRVRVTIVAVVKQ